MRTAGLPNFRKLWGKIDKDLEAGDYELEIHHNYNVNPFKGKKKLVFATANAFGGKNYLLANCHLVLGVICLLFTIVNFVESRQEKKEKK